MKKRDGRGFSIGHITGSLAASMGMEMHRVGAVSLLHYFRLDVEHYEVLAQKLQDTTNLPRFQIAFNSHAI